MSEYLSFRKHYTPGIIHVLFWVLLFANTIDALFGGHDFWGATFTLFVGPVLLRVVCELILIFFEINDSLAAIRGAAATPATVVVPEIVPAVTPSAPQE